MAPSFEARSSIACLSVLRGFSSTRASAPVGPIGPLASPLKHSRNIAEARLSYWDGGRQLDTSARWADLRCHPFPDKIRRRTEYKVLACSAIIEAAIPSIGKPVLPAVPQWSIPALLVSLSVPGLRSKNEGPVVAGKRLAQGIIRSRCGDNTAVHTKGSATWSGSSAALFTISSGNLSHDCHRVHGRCQRGCPRSWLFLGKRLALARGPRCCFRTRRSFETERQLFGPNCNVSPRYCTASALPVAPAKTQPTL